MPPSNAIDAGVRLPNINDDYRGEAPDLGVLERATPWRSTGSAGSETEAARQSAADYSIRL